MAMLKQTGRTDRVEANAQAIARLNEWLDLAKPSSDWKPDPLLETLPEKLRALAAGADVGRLRFRPEDSRHLQAAILLHEVSSVACGDRVEDVPVALALFDWTVRNIQLAAGETVGRIVLDPQHLSQIPGETLLFGAAGAAERSWLFMLLARQRGLDVVMLSYADPNDPPHQIDWLPALVSQPDVDSPVELYLFDPVLGLPIPGPEGAKVATLAQVQADDTLLRQLDLDADHPYPVTSSDLSHVVAEVECGPNYLPARMRLLESRLRGDQKLVLSVDATAVAQWAQRAQGVSSAIAWQVPFDVRALRLTNDARVRQALQEKLAQRSLPFQFSLLPREQQWVSIGLSWGRHMHLIGNYTGQRGTNRAIRPPLPQLNVEELASLDRRQRRALQEQRLNEQLNTAADHGANGLYQMARLTQEQIESLKLEPVQKELLRRAKQNASYWLGLIAYERGMFDLAVEYFEVRTLQAHPQGVWTHGANYNLGRALESAGRNAEAIARYESDKTSPQYHGNHLRAGWLARQMNAATNEAASAAKGDEP